jgi:hypothetical protein
MDYMFGGTEQQQWYGAATTGYAKSITNNYLYKWALKGGACPAAATAGKHRQDQ